MRCLNRKYSVPITLIPVLAVMTLIFCFSAQNGQESSEASGVVVRWVLHLTCPGFDGMEEPARSALYERTSFLVRKTAHFSEYAALGFTLLLHILAWSCRKPIRFPGLITFMTGFAYAVSDELHQGLVAGRAPSIVDVILDGCGVFFGLFLLHGVLRLSQQRRKNTSGTGRGKRSSDTASK